MLIYCTWQMHVQQATYASELHVNVQQIQVLIAYMKCKNVCGYTHTQVTLVLVSSFIFG